MSRITHINKRYIHSTKKLRFPLSDYNVFWLREPRIWDHILCGNHPEMYPEQKVPYLKPIKIEGRMVEDIERERSTIDIDTFNMPWEINPWQYEKLNKKEIKCTLITQEYGKLHFNLNRHIGNQINQSLRNKCTLFNLYLKHPISLIHMTPYKLIKESWKHYDNNMEFNNNKHLSNGINGDGSIMLNLPNNIRNSFQCFLKQIDVQFVFENDIECMHFEEYIPHKSMNIIIPIRFYGLDQWFPATMRNQWNAPLRSERPRYIQHAWEIEFQWDGINPNKIPSHLSVTVEQFCLPWKTEILLSDINLPDNIKPLKHPKDIKILSLDIDRQQKKSSHGLSDDDSTS
mmetsp:Transcript_3107/g.3784  ORF Transcript_3107/g.3784 Transcript_3107/m.3784 type:complete len:344 (+) Transcript_3107:13-1044(+)